mmetsp:Transcript_11020/g.35005  ORF Transcript_11020/g.35005 Transcript_11020/m.35005 type:complete len:94 (+) Transcript_11020:1212-1493(+)
MYMPLAADAAAEAPCGTDETPARGIVIIDRMLEGPDADAIRCPPPGAAVESTMEHRVLMAPGEVYRCDAPSAVRFCEALTINRMRHEKSGAAK